MSQSLLMSFWVPWKQNDPGGLSCRDIFPQLYSSTSNDLVLNVSTKSQPQNQWTTHSATDVLAPTTMKNAAKCDTSCELQNPVSHQNFERTLHFLRSMSVGVSVEAPLLPLVKEGESTSPSIVTYRWGECRWQVNWKASVSQGTCSFDPTGILVTICVKIYTFYMYSLYC